MTAAAKDDEKPREQSERAVKDPYPEYEERPYEKAITPEHREALKAANLL
jgi:hypothetical protein